MTRAVTISTEPPAPDVFASRCRYFARARRERHVLNQLRSYKREGAVLAAGEQVPHFDLATFEGTRAVYRTIWQHKHLVLVALTPEQSAAATAYVSRVRALISRESSGDVACVFTTEAVAGLAAPAVLVADRWGEIHFVSGSPDLASLPSPEALDEWVQHVRARCPECEGEAR
jgi:hypothetical protein